MLPFNSCSEVSWTVSKSKAMLLPKTLIMTLQQGLCGSCCKRAHFACSSSFFR